MRSIRAYQVKELSRNRVSNTTTLFTTYLLTVYTLQFAAMLLAALLLTSDIMRITLKANAVTASVLKVKPVVASYLGRVRRRVVFYPLTRYQRILVPLVLA